jgi:hypothetical protein
MTGTVTLRGVTEDLAERYLRLGLRLGRHVGGVVDAYFGPAELAAAVDAEELVEPARLVGDADELLGALDDGWLRDQVTGLRTYAGILAGEALSFADEVLGCYGVPATFTDEAVFAAAHERLEELLPGSGSLAERHQRWRASMWVPTDRIEPTIAAVVALARTHTAALIDLPDGEGVELEIVHDVPWHGYNSYLGGYRGRVEVNVDLPLSAFELLVLALHETYPGHQAERAVKEQRLVREGGQLAETIVLVPTPQSVIAEGIGELAPPFLLAGAAGPALADVVRTAGVEFDLEHALAVTAAAQPTRWAEVNAAIMLHERGAGGDEVRAYLERWGLVAPDLSAHFLRFVQEPTSRTYVVNYPAGFALCDQYVGGDPDRFRRLLTSQLRVADLLAA